MKICYVKKSRDTASRMRDLIPEDLMDSDVVINLGNSNPQLDDEYFIINSAESVRNAADKQRMFEIFNRNNIKCVKYYDLNNFDTFTEAKRQMLYLNKCLVIRDNGYKLIGRKNSTQLPKCGYGTVREQKLKEYRIIVFRGRFLKVYEKLPFEQCFAWKQDKCKFQRVFYPDFEPEVVDNIINSVKCLGLDLGGVDLLLNTKGEYKILEVNSGMGMSDRTISQLYKRLKTYLWQNRHI